MIKRIPQNSILVELEKIADDQYKFASGLTIYMNTAYKPENHVRIYGKCVAIPNILTKGDIIKWEEDDCRHISSIVPEVMVGDTVYFTYISVNKQNLLEYEGKSYYSINYAQILCVVRTTVEIDIDKLTDFCNRTGQLITDLLDKHHVNNSAFALNNIAKEDKRIIPIGGNVMCEEYFGKDAKEIEVDGRKIHAQTSKSGLITNIVKKASEKYAVVKVTGTPLKEDSEIGFGSGDIIVFPNKYGFKNNIEGKDYLFLKYWDVLAVVGNINTESVV